MILSKSMILNLLKISIVSAIVLFMVMTNLKASEIGYPKVFPGSHISKITGLSLLNKGEQLISTSIEGTIHIWEKRNSSWEIARSIYSSKNEEIYAMAISPDEKNIAIAGNTFNKRLNYYIKIYSLATGKIKQIIKAHQNVINSLNYSNDGKLLLSSSFDKNIKIWSTKTWNLLKVLKGHTAPVQYATFNNNSDEIISGSLNGEVFLWKNNWNLHLLSSASDNKPVYKVLVSKNTGDIIFIKGHTFYRYNKNGLKIKEKELSIAGNISAMEFESNKNVVNFFTMNPVKSYALNLSTYKASKTNLLSGFDKVKGCSVIVTTLTSQDESNLFLGDICGNILLSQEEHNDILGGFLNLGGVDKIRLNKSGDKIFWDILGVKNNKTFQLELSPQAKDFNDPLIVHNPPLKQFGVFHEYGAKEIERSSDGIELKIFDGKNLIGEIRKNSLTGYQHTAYSFLLGGKSIVSGGNNGSLIQYSLEGEIEGSFIGHQGRILSVATTKNGEYLISGSTDNTLKIWSLKDKKLLLSVYHHPDSKRWAVWTPAGYYKVSESGLSIFGWIFDKGIDQQTKYVRATQVSKKFYRPDKIDMILRGKNIERNAVFKEKDLGNIPELIVLSPKNNSSFTDKEIDIVIKVRYSNIIKIYVNGAYIDNEKGLERDSVKSYRKTITLKKGLNKIEIIAENLNAVSPKLSLNIIGNFNEENNQYIYETLNIVAIGANSGESNKFNRLHYADDDARKIASFYNKQKQSKLSQNRAITILASDSKHLDQVKEPTKREIIKALKTFNKAKAKDLNILYLSGHGIYINNEYYFVPDNFKRDMKGRINTNTLVSWSTISKAIISAKGTKVIFIDTCYSGITNLVKIGNELQNGGVYVVSATNKSTKAKEYQSIEGGALSYAVIDSLSKKYSAKNKQGIKTINFLDFLNNTDKVVTKFTNQKQKPYITMAGSNIPIAVEQ